MSLTTSSTKRSRSLALLATRSWISPCSVGLRYRKERSSSSLLTDCIPSRLESGA